MKIQWIQTNSKVCVDSVYMDDIWAGRGGIAEILDNASGVTITINPGGTETFVPWSNVRFMVKRH